MKRFFRNIFILINILVAVCLMFSYTAVFINPAVFWIPAFFGLAYPYIFLVNILFILFWVVFNAKYSLISILPILAGISFSGSFVQLRGEKTEKEGIRVCSYNVRYFVGDNILPNKETADKITDFLDKGKFDIICLQEAGISNLDSFSVTEIRNRLRNINHMQLAHASNSGGPVIYTRYPIVNMGEIRYKNSGNLVIFSDLVIQKDTFRVYNCHLQSYRLDPYELNSLDSLRFTNTPETYDGVKSMGAKMKQAFIKRAEQVLRLESHIRKSPYPVIVCGDFNDTPVSYAYHTLKKNLLDAFVESGQGIGNTYNGRLPSFRIDYILHDPVFNSFGFKVGRRKFSDHFPIQCKLMLNRTS